MNGTGRIKGLDGLRAVSALIVFGVHATIPGLSGGGIGVDIFFVLSGFVITRGLAAEIAETGRISISIFYLRRALRLWPLLIGVCLLFSLSSRVTLSEEVLPSIFYISNWTRSWLGYPRVFGHTWSLAIEEQFYILWPLFLLIVLRCRHPARIIITIAFACSVWRSFLFIEGSTMMRLFNGFDTRHDGLMIGAALALSSPPVFKRVGQLWPIALVFFLWALWYETWESHWLYFGGFTALGCMSASFIAKISTSQSGWLTRALEWKPLAGLGVISYGFYMWHFPILVLTGTKFGKLTSLVCFMATLICAIVSWFVLERPILSIRNRAFSKAGESGRMTV